MGAQALVTGGEGGLRAAGGDTVLQSPQNGSFVPAPGGDVGKGVNGGVGFRLEGQLGAVAVVLKMGVQVGIPGRVVTGIVDDSFHLTHGIGIAGDGIGEITGETDPFQCFAAI